MIVVPHAMPSGPEEAEASLLVGCPMHCPSTDDHDEEEEEQPVPFEPFENVPLEP